MKFPTERPPGANFPRPYPDRPTNLTPPGFCWWRAADPGACRYRLRVLRDGREAYVSPLLDDPVHVPDRTLAPGSYTWVVDAVDASDRTVDTAEPRAFSIADNPIEQPWVDPADWLARVPRERPRAFFLASQLDEVRASLQTGRAAAFAALKSAADSALDLEPPAEPDYDRIEDPAQRRLAYQDCFHATRQVHDTGMRSLALCYLLTGDRKYGEKAKELIVDAAAWDVEGISSILAPYGDEVGLGLVRVGAEVFDWIHDLFDASEVARVEKMVRARADQMLRRLLRRDFLYRPEESHAGRLPGFLLEHAVVLAEDERAPIWADYALRCALTCHPHWAGPEGGWAQGVPYGMSYNTTHLMPYHTWWNATGHNLWQGPFHDLIAWWVAYCVSPVGEIMPFGDTEDRPVRPSQARTLVAYHAGRLGNAELKAWSDLVQEHDGDSASVAPFPGIIMPDDTAPGDLAALPQDRAFAGVGWAALHSHLAEPDRDLMVSFRCSPYGGVSHGHASQNDIAIQKGGRALICAGGLRFPQHGTPFHKEYCQQTLSHNCVLVNGEGQVFGGGKHNGHIVDFKTSEHVGYVCGDATPAYDGRLTKCVRHVALLRPSVIVLVDELEAESPSSWQWLLHAFEPFAIDASEQGVTSTRRGARLGARLFASAPLSLSQTDDWAVAPDKGYKTLSRPLPDKRWHFTAETTGKVPTCRIASVMDVRLDTDPATDLDVSRSGSVLTVRHGDASVAIDLESGPALSF